MSLRRTSFPPVPPVQASNRGIKRHVVIDPRMVIRIDIER